MLTREVSTAPPVEPSFIEPMYAEAVRELPDGGLWTYEAKLDGYRKNAPVIVFSLADAK